MKIKSTNKKPEKTLSIIIVSFNTETILKNCLDSIWNNYHSDLESRQFEVIVVDNASTDQTIEALKTKYKWVKLKQLDQNYGFAKANNIAVTKARGDFVLFLNPDTIVPPRTLNYMIEYMQKDDQIGVATCKLLLADGRLDDASHRGFPTPMRALWHFIGLSKIFSQSMFFNGYHLGYQNMERPHEIDACVGAFLLIRRALGQKLKWFDEEYFWYGEDLDLCYRVKELGYKVMFVPDVSITHLKGVSSGIKKHSQHLSQADSQVKTKATQARFEVMRIFYRKHYQNRYPGWLKQLVFSGIWIKQKLTEIGL